MFAGGPQEKIPFEEPIYVGWSINLPKTAGGRGSLCFTPERFGASPDGTGDNTAAMQAAVDELERTQEYGILFIPEGSYRFSGTVELWRGIRLIGFGAKRPLFFLADGTAGFEGPDSKYIFHFRDRRPKPGAELRDAQNTSFYGGIRNINFDLGHGNKGAVAARFRIAQLNSLEDIDFHCQDAKAAVEMVGNEIERCRFYGWTVRHPDRGDGAVLAVLPGDSLFDGQERACISSYRAGLTMVRVS